MRNNGRIGKMTTEYIRAHGPIKAFIWFASKALKKISRLIYQAVDYHLAVYDLSNNHGFLSDEDSDLQFKTLGVEDLGNVERDFGSECARSFAERMTHSRGYMVYCADKVAGYAWTCKAQLNGEGIKPFLINLHPHHGNVYIYDCYTASDYRNKQLFSKLMRYLLSTARDEGFIKAFLTFRNDNRPMYKVMTKFGFDIIGRVICRKILWHIIIDTSDLQNVCYVSRSVKC